MNNCKLITEHSHPYPFQLVVGHVPLIKEGTEATAIRDPRKRFAPEEVSEFRCGKVPRFGFPWMRVVGLMWPIHRFEFEENRVQP